MQKIPKEEQHCIWLLIKHTLVNLAHIIIFAFDFRYCIGFVGKETKFGVEKSRRRHIPSPSCKCRDKLLNIYSIKNIKVKNRDVQITQLLVNMGAKLSATDNAGDNGLLDFAHYSCNRYITALHLAIRSRSRRLTQILLVNPSDSKLLYRPNKLGETPYSIGTPQIFPIHKIFIDQESPQPILPTIFGPIGTDMDLKNLLGFDSYSDVRLFFAH